MTLQEMTARFAPVDLSADLSALPANERQALAKLVEAATVIDALYLRQVWAGNATMLQTLARDTSDLDVSIDPVRRQRGAWLRYGHPAQLKGIPVDIAPRFVTAEALVAEGRD